MLRRPPTTTPNNAPAQDGRGPGPSTNSPLTSFLSRPAKWFNRSVSSNSVTEGTGRRKHKISHPTDPRPILDGYAGSNARSVMDLSTTRLPNSLDISHPPPSPSVPNISTSGLGDLRSISKKSWSRSADDLGSLSYSPVSPGFHERVALYRGRSNSNTSPQPFPTGPQPFPSTEPPLTPSLTLSPPEASMQAHTRSQSFGPKMATKRAIPPSPKRKGSGPPSLTIPVPSMLEAPAVTSPKRASQIMHNTGYVTVAKSWKPYKLDMKGSKLYFYKLPGERSTQVRAMFPTGLEEDEEPEQAPPPSPRPTKKRAYWGKSTHPDLAKDGSEGTFEALIHEAVFGTRGDNWRKSIALALPLLVGKDKFEAELRRWEEGSILKADYASLHPAVPDVGYADWTEPPEDPHILARTLTCFHRASIPTGLTLPLPDAFFGSDAHAHWLTKYVMMQVLQTDRRVEAISLWIRVGELCRQDGDECTWSAIRAALCSPPIARLDKAWKRVDSSVVLAWASGMGVVEPRLTPWGGDLKTKIQHAVEQARDSEKEDVYLVEPLLTTWAVFEQCRKIFEGCERHAEELPIEELKITEYWSYLARGGLPTKFERVEQFMPLSIAAEPRRRGLYEPHFWSRPPSNHPSNASLIPLLFPEPLPTVTLVDRAIVLRGRLDSDATDIQALRAVDGHIRQVRPITADPSEGALSALGRGGTVIPVHDGEILLVVAPSSHDSAPSSRPSSRPPSASITEQGLGRAPSMRVKPGSSQGLDRKSSMARRSSLPALSNRQAYVTAEFSSERPLRVLVQAGTIDRLVDLLVHGLDNVSVSVADDNGEMSLREGTRDLVVDRAEFASVWWNVFRSFVTPFVFFELLKKMYSKEQLHKKVVLDTVTEWLKLGNGGLDVLDDVQLYQSFQKFLNTTPDNAHPNTPLGAAWAELHQTFKSQTMRPSSTKTSVPISPDPGAQRTRNMSTREPPDLERITPEELMEILDGMALATFSNVTEEDLYITSDLLETQSADRTGWFAQLREIEDVEIQTIYSHVHDVPPSTLITEMGPDSLYRLLPPSVRGCIRGYSILRKWLIGQIVVKGLGVQRRQARMEFLLKVIEVSRGGTVGEKSVRSFVESVVTSAVMSVESRMYVRAWQTLAQSRGTQCDSMSSLLARMAEKERLEPLTVDIGWVLERLLDVISTPDVVESASDGQGLVNFDKRRHLVNLITATPPARNPEVTYRGFERLNNIEREALTLQFDHKSIREDAVREAAGKKLARPFPFQRLVQLQTDKHRRDRNWRIRLQKEKQTEQSKNEKRGEVLSKAMQRGHRNKKSMSAFLHFMRPISSAFVSDSFSQSSLGEWTPSGRPAIVLSLTDARVRPVANPERSWTFEIDTEDGGHYVVQAANKAEMTKWLEVIGRVTSLAAKRRLTYVTSKPDVQVDGMGASGKGNPKAVFGVEIQTLLEREADGDEVQPGAIPRVIHECLTEIEKRGLTEVGIYRIAGATSEINALKDAFNRGRSPVTESTDIHAVCDIVKSWFRSLPEPLFPPVQYRQIIDATKLEDLDTRLSEFHRIVQELPEANADLLKRMVEHLDKVADYEEYNQMTAEALAIVFSPNLLRTADFGLLLSNMGHSNKLVKALITHFHAIFDESDNVDEEPELPVLDDLEEEDTDRLPSDD